VKDAKLLRRSAIGPPEATYSNISLHNRSLLIAAAGPFEDAFSGAARHAEKVSSPKLTVSAIQPVSCAPTALIWPRQQQHPSRIDVACQSELRLLDSLLDQQLCGTDAT